MSGLPDDEPALAALVQELIGEQACHTVILYGSRARGEATAASDYDLLAVRGRGPVVHDARPWNGAWLDLFLYPEAKLRRANADSLRFRQGRVLAERDGFGTRLLQRLQRLHARGPRPLPADEAVARRAWAEKMLARIRQDDTEAHYRRAWLLTALLEDYFVLQGRWYEGPKASLAWLAARQPEDHALFAAALCPGAGIAALETLARRVAAA